MRIVLNGDAIESPAATVRALLESRSIDPAAQGVAVAINDRVVRRSEWASTTLSDGDRVEIIAAMQGG
jgi:sulfur carrier protein